MPCPTRPRDSAGLTLIELLIVVLILGVLSAIAIPIFAGQQAQAQDASAKSDIANAKQALASYFNVEDRSSSDIQDFFADYGLVISDGTSGLELRSGGAGGLCFQEVSASGATFHANENDGVEPGPCGGTTSLWAYDYDE